MIRAASLAAFLISALPATAQEKTKGIVAVGGSVTEIIYALGAGDRVIARDTTSSFPPEVEALPDIGYMRALSPEGVLSVNPEIIIAESGAGPTETITVLEGANIPFITVPDEYSASGVSAKIIAVGEAIGEEANAKALADDLKRELDEITRSTNEMAGDNKKRVLFILSTQGGRIMASGTETAAAAMIEMAGAENAVSAFDGYKPLTDEAVIAAAPDAILMMDRGGDHDSSIEELLQMPVIASTPAAKNRAVIRMNGLYLLGFGPRTAKAVVDLNQALYGG
ncbi:heme/hemin ABC transporter substrate-binding protein [Lentibacter sp. XHP0401]|uniref:heme/hemin ABC transporter substrate-binding protein n=1 Tax=Lentibacter sp. XHP0401 TaxID=2984334 RepID=UPI0021E713A8|nr:ABC transporter substrate-binding protein [Lentibacter sp. XHP0401]MCV2894259.1 ABC transporter substrate-binding protein [Lentibacter sp. XHP0401]